MRGFLLRFIELVRTTRHSALSKMQNFAWFFVTRTESLPKWCKMACIVPRSRPPSEMSESQRADSNLPRSCITAISPISASAAVQVEMAKWQGPIWSAMALMRSSKEN